MPNDPRVKFKKKIHDASHNIIGFSGGGSGRRSRSLFEEGNLPRPPGGGEPPGQIDIPTGRNIEPFPQPLKPGLNPGEITGITIGALAGLGTLEVARRAYLEYLEEERKKGRSGTQPVSQSDRPIKARRGGNILERSRIGVSRGISRAIRNLSPTRAAGYNPVTTGTEMTHPAPRPAPAPPPAPAPAPAPVSEIISPIDQLKQTKSEITLIENQLSTETNLTIKNNMKEQLKILKRKATALEKTMPARPAPSAATTTPVERPAPPPDSVAANTRSRTGTQLNQKLQQDKLQEDFNRIQAKIPKAERAFEGGQIAQADLARTNVPKQEVYLKGRLTSNLNKLDKIVAEIELRLLNPNLTLEQRTTLNTQQERIRRQITTIEEGQRTTISKTVTSEVSTTIQTPANDNLRSTQPTREFESRVRPVVEGTEMGVVRREYFPEIGEIVQAAMQQMGSRKPLERARVGQTPQGERIIGPEFSEAQAAGVGIDFNAPRPPPQPAEDRMAKSSDTPLERPATEQRPEIEPMGSRPPPTETAPEMTRPPAPVRRPRQVEEMGEEIGSLRAQNAIAEFNDTIDPVLTSAKNEGFIIPEAPEHIKAQGELAVKKYQYEQALEFAEKEGFYISPTEVVKGERVTTGKARSKKKQLQLFEEVYQRARAQEGGRPRLAAAPAEVRAPAPEARARAAAPEARAAAAPEARAAAPEAMAARAAPAPEVTARSAPSAAPEIAARTRMGVPELTAPPPVAPEERASFAERQAFFEETSRRVAPPIEPAGPSPPPSAPGSGTATPQEGATVERTPAERASLAEEVRLGLIKGKTPRQKAKINLGKPKTTANPLERFVAPQFRNAPNIEIHPGAKGLRGALTELSARVPRLVPTRQVLLNAGGSLAAEGGGMVAGFYAGSAAGKAMSEYFATHPPKNRGEEFGQALATSMVALGVGNLTAKVVTYVIKQGVKAALIGEVSGSISSAGAAGASAIVEAVLFATVATTTQFYTTKALEDAGYNHATSRGLGSAAATEALLGLEFVSFMLKGGPANPLAVGSFVASELFILGFGIWSYFEETEEGRLEDIAEQAEREAEAARIAEARVERQTAIDKINRTNHLRAGFMVAMETHDYDFDKLYATLSDEDKEAMGISTPEGKSGFQRQVESAFDPFGSFAEPSPGIVAPEVLSPIEQQRRDVFNSYINWYLGELRGETQPPFNFNDPKVQELNEYSGGTWQTAAAVTATTNHMQAERVHPLILNAQNEIINAFHNERKTIEEMPPDVVRYANLDSNFRDNYEAYIVTEAQAQILIEFNRTQYTYNDMDPKLVEIANRDPNFRAAADAYYQTMANQARDLNLPISEIARLNALMENEQAVEIGKLNDARNKIIERNMAENQAQIDAYNANIIRQINIYGDNFDAIIRNINDQALLSGHTFMYATTKADLYRQLHMEMPELELVDPVDEIDQPNATWHPGKGRKIGDTALYGYRYNLTDEQNQELEDMIARREITRQDAENQANFIRERDRYLYEETDKERADALKMSLADYYAKYGMPVDPYTMPIVDFKLEGKPPDNGRVRMPDGSIRIYRNGVLVNIDTTEIITETPPGTYNPALPQQPDGEIRMPDGSIRTYKDGKVTFVQYNTSTPGNERLSPDEINAQIDATRDPTPTQPVSTVLFNGERKMPDGTTRTYKAGKVTSIGYPEGYPLKQMLDKNGLANLNNQEGLYYDPNPPTPVTPETPETPVTPTTPTEPLKNGIVKMPDGSTRTYQNGVVIFVSYPGSTPLDAQLTPKQINEEEGIQNATYTGPAVTPTTPVAPTSPLQQGAVKMPDGSKRIYIDGKVVSVAYPDGVKGPTINEINSSEGIKTVAPDSNNPVNPVTPVNPGGLPTQIETPTQPARELTYEELQVMYQKSFQLYDTAYKKSYNQDPAVTPEIQAAYIEALLRSEHTNRLANGTAAPAPTQTTPTPTTNQPLPMVPGARSFEYADSGTQATTTTTPTTTPSVGGPSDYRPRGQEPMQNNQPTTNP